MGIVLCKYLLFFYDERRRILARIFYLFFVYLINQFIPLDKLPYSICFTTRYVFSLFIISTVFLISSFTINDDLA